MKFEHYITSPLDEAAYEGNIGFEELVKFYKVCSEKEKEEMESVLKASDWKKFTIIIKRVTGTKLK